MMPEQRKNKKKQRKRVPEQEQMNKTTNKIDARARKQMMSERKMPERKNNKLERKRVPEQAKTKQTNKSVPEQEQL